MSQDSSIWCPHVTVATVAADHDGNFLMIEEDIHGQLRYNQPAGHLEPGETLQQAAVRETLEESGWSVALDHFIGTYQWYSPVHREYIVRFAFAAHTLERHADRTLDAGITRTLWMSRAEIAAQSARLRSPLTLASIDDWLAGRRLPLSTIRDLHDAGATPA